MDSRRDALTDSAAAMRISTKRYIYMKIYVDIFSPAIPQTSSLPSHASSALAGGVSAVKTQTNTAVQMAYVESSSITGGKKLSLGQRIKARFKGIKTASHKLQGQSAFIQKPAVSNRAAAKNVLREAASEAMRKDLEKDDSADVETTTDSWLKYQKAVENEFQPLMQQNESSLRGCLTRFQNRPDLPRNAASLTLLLGRLATGSRPDQLTSSVHPAPSHKVPDDARVVSLVTPRMHNMGIAAAPAFEWFKQNADKPMPAGSENYWQARSLCNNLLHTIHLIKIGRYIAPDLPAPVAAVRKSLQQSKKPVYSEQNRPVAAPRTRSVKPEIPPKPARLVEQKPVTN